LIEAEANDALREIQNQAFNVFYYDGDHSMEATAGIVGAALSHMEDESLLIIDDFAWSAVQAGTEAGLAQGRFRQVYSWRLDNPGERSGLIDHELWWNGLYVAAIERLKS